MRIQDVMTRDIVHISPDETVGTARQQLELYGVHHLVVMQRKQVVGVLSDRDLSDVSDSVAVSEVMTRSVITIAPTATIRQAAGVLDGRTIGCLPVMKDGKIEGIVTTTDVVRAVAKGAIHVNGASERPTVRRREARAR